MAEEDIKQAVIDMDDSLQKSLTHTRPDPKTQAPHSRPGPNPNEGSSAASTQTSNGSAGKS